MKMLRLVFVLSTAFLLAFASSALAQQVDAVPVVTGMKTADAQQLLTRQGWKTGMEYRTVTDPKQDGTVLATRPPAGTRVSKQQVVIIVAGKMADQTRVPYVTGKPLAEAQKILVDNKLNAQVTQQPVANPNQNGMVIGQKIAVGTPLAPGSMVPLVVGVYTAPAEKPVPDVRGMPGGPAVQRLQSLGWKAETQRKTVTDPQQNNKVLQQSPEPGTQAVPGKQAVTLTIGQHQETVSVPSVVGMTFERAQAALKQATLSINAGARTVQDRTKIGTVLDQSPAPGTAVKPGTQVVVTMGLDPNKKIPLPQANPYPPYNPPIPADVVNSKQ